MAALPIGIKCHASDAESNSNVFAHFCLEILSLCPPVLSTEPGSKFDESLLLHGIKQPPKERSRAVLRPWVAPLSPQAPAGWPSKSLQAAQGAARRTMCTVYFQKGPTDEG